MSSELNESFAIEQHKGASEPDWATFGNPFENKNVAANSVIPINSSHPFSEALYPEDSIIHDWMVFSRRNKRSATFGGDPSGLRRDCGKNHPNGILWIEVSKYLCDDCCRSWTSEEYFDRFCRKARSSGFVRF